MEPFTRLTSTAVVLPHENVDTDQIIPARFLKVTTRDGLGDALFADWRYDEAGQPRPDFVLNSAEARLARILVAGDNFGCGSSREHAPWALLGFGFRAVISTRFADIFRSNAIGNGLLPVTLDSPSHGQLIGLLEGDPGAQLTIDLASGTLMLPDGGTAAFPVDPFDRHCLLEGVDRLGYLLSRADEIARYEAQQEAAHQAPRAAAAVARVST
jgi:3-isopropylmalate/(R)-2-methylmalate dehydratase small subunit